MGGTPKTALPPQDRAASLLPFVFCLLSLPYSQLPIPDSLKPELYTSPH
ncbi:hypothetical protein [Moorena sp. SIO2C4]|nr:hypothetical protein [Moorena sp. SIO2C4]NES39977.1 hypothetical protein [Moorena sp. SIO2C4]